MKKYSTIRRAGFVALAVFLACGAGPLQANDASADKAVAEQAFEELYSRGKGGFMSNCSSCHGAEGQGQSGPSLVGNELLGHTGEIARTVLKGFSYMPHFGDELSDEQVAAILTYIRNSWDNEFGVVTPLEVSAFR